MNEKCPWWYHYSSSCGAFCGGYTTLCEWRLTGGSISLRQGAMLPLPYLTTCLFLFSMSHWKCDQLDLCSIFPAHTSTPLWIPSPLKIKAKINMLSTTQSKFCDLKARNTKCVYIPTMVTHEDALNPPIRL